MYCFEVELVQKLLNEFLDDCEAIAGLAYLGSDEGQEPAVGEEGLLEAGVEEVGMTLDYVLKGLDLFQVLGEHQPVLLDHFIAQVVYEVFYEVYHPLV